MNERTKVKIEAANAIELFWAKVINPYREDLDSNTFAKHSQIVQKNIDEILSKETDTDDIDTKPGMMRILSKRVNEVDKEMA